MERNQLNPNDDQWMGRHAGDPEYQWKLNAASDHIDDDDDNESDDDAGDWGRVDPLDDGDGTTTDTDPAAPGSAV